MKIGFSFGRCIKDIVNGTMDYEDVLVIIARTRMPDEATVANVINEYMYREHYLEGLDREQCLEVGLRLFNEGKVHQARLSAMSFGRGPAAVVWADVVPTTDMDEQVKEAWNHYRFLLNLTSKLPDEETIR